MFMGLQLDNFHIADTFLTGTRVHSSCPKLETCLHCSKKIGIALQLLHYLSPQGLKTGMYYLRTRPAANAIQFTVDQTVVQKVKEKKRQAAEMTKEEKEYQEAALACSIQNREACVMCSA